MPVLAADDGSANLVAEKDQPPEPWSVLTHALADDDADDRIFGIAALGTIEKRGEAEMLLICALNDRDSTVRRAAAAALGERKVRNAAPALKAALEDESPLVRFAAAQALWKLGDRSGQEFLVEVLAGESKPSDGVFASKMREVKETLKDPRELTLLGIKEGGGALFSPISFGVRAFRELTQDVHAAARARSASLLGASRTPAVREALEVALEDDNWIVRAAAAQALADGRHRRSLARLEEQLTDDNDGARAMVAASVIRLRGDDFPAPLMHHAKK